MNNTLIRRLSAFVVFVISAIQFIKTAQPSVSFWDPGEISAASYGLQVSHPPGEPLFQLVGRVLFMLPFPGNIGFRINLLSVFSSAFAVMLTFLIAVRLIQLYKGKGSQNLLDAMATYGSAAIGALALSFCDTFWFNGVESNMFAASTFLAALMAWLMLLFYGETDASHSWKYIFLIAYILGLAMGVHLMSVLMIVPVTVAVAYKRFVIEERNLKSSALIFVGHAVVLVLIALAMWSNQTSSEPPGSFEELTAYDLNFIAVMGAVSLVIAGIFWKKVFRWDSFYCAIAIAGIVLAVAFAGIFKRLPKLLGMIAGDDAIITIIVLIMLLGALGYAVHWSRKRNKILPAVAAFSFILIIFGYTTYTETIIRANTHPPMNENDPSTVTRLVTYLGREQYGDWPLFKRRWSSEPLHQQTWQNYTSDLDFFWRYQTSHMYIRYALWNFAGRESTIQDTGVNWKQLYGIPLFIGLFGLYWHFRRDWKTASIFLLMFLFLGYMIDFYPNAQEMQPRERDYFYAGSFLVFSLWIALGMRGMLDLVEKKLSRPGAALPVMAGILAVGAMFIPIRMAQTNFFTHDRSRNWLPRDFAYNLLQSCPADAILITNGDNDTFPLWYLQDVEAVRRDVRIVNLSLVNTEWYIKALKNETPYGAAKIKMRLTDEQVDRLQPMEWKAQKVTVPVPPDAIKRYGVTDSATIANGSFTFTMAPTMNYGDVGAIRVQDYMVREIVMNNAWERPIYFANTCGEDAEIGLSDYLRIEGLAAELRPERKPRNPNDRYAINDSVMTLNLLPESPGWSTSYRPGFRYSGLNDTTIFYNENEQRMVQNYRNTYIIYAEHCLYGLGNKAKCIAVLDRLQQAMPGTVVPSDYRSQYGIASMYFSAGAQARYNAMASSVEKSILAILNTDSPDQNEMENMYNILIEIYNHTGQYGKAADILERFVVKYPNDPNLKKEIERYRALAAQPKK